MSLVALVCGEKDRVDVCGRERERELVSRTGREVDLCTQINLSFSSPSHSWSSFPLTHSISLVGAL